MVFPILDLPIIPIRKAGKMPGNTLKQEYGNKYSNGILEMKKMDLSQYNSVLVIDDGIASGGSISCALKLLSDNNLSVDKVIVYTMLRHTYTELCDNMKEFNIKMYHTFDL
jgi:adenine phosphoribosyltransferase